MTWQANLQCIRRPRVEHNKIPEMLTRSFAPTPLAEERDNHGNVADHDLVRS